MTPPLQGPTIPGLTYVADWISPDDESSLLTTIDAQEWRDDLKTRLVQHYGYLYDYTAKSVDPSSYVGPLPNWISRLADRLVDERLFLQCPDQAIINEYHPGSGISKHVDCKPCFGPVIASLSLGSDCVMRFRQRDTQVTVDIVLARRSLLVLAGDARYGWTHEIASRKSDIVDGYKVMRRRRVSVTFRCVILTSHT